MRNHVWWIAFYHRGQKIRESSKSAKESVACALLKQRLAETQTGQFVADQGKVTFDDLVEGIATDYALNNRRSFKSGAAVCIKHLREFFGLDAALDITSNRLKTYQQRRREQGASVSSINGELRVLRRMFSIQIDGGKLSRKPKFVMLDGEKVREGFVDHGDFLRVLGGLPEHLKPAVEFLYYAGWRKSAVRNLQWKEIDMRGRAARLKIANFKNSEPWVLPLSGRLWEIIQARAKVRRLDCPYVFHDGGQKIGDFRKAWQTASVAAGLGSFVKAEKPAEQGAKKKRQRKKYTGLLVHDMRRCAARNLSRAGVSEQVAMRITGHKTPSMYRRYRIIDENELREALDKTQAHLAAVDGQGGRGLRNGHTSGTIHGQ